MRNDIYEEGIDYREEDRWDVSVEVVQNNFDEVVGKDNDLFIAKVKNNESLFESFLSGFSDEVRQHYNCRHCKHFINKYGSLVTIDDDGNVVPVLWKYREELPEIFIKPFENMRKNIESQNRVLRMFFTNEKILGNPKTGIWTHYNLEIPDTILNKSSYNYKTANQLVHSRHEDFTLVLSAIDKYTISEARSALELLLSGSIYRAETFVPSATWFYDLLLRFKENKNVNLIYKEVAKTSTSFCHISSSMVGTLLDDIKAGLSTPVIIARFVEKADPENYARSKSAPSESALIQAEKLVKTMGIEDSLRRRYAKIEELPQEYIIWNNPNENIKVVDTKQKESKPTGIFSNIATSSKKEHVSDDVQINIPTQTMTWVKFKRTILPTAVNLEAKMNEDRAMAIVTSAVEDSKNILKWDNSFSWYYTKGIDGEIKRRLTRDGGKFENVAMRCSLIWEGRTDLDLHCHYFNKSAVNSQSRIPTEHIYFRNNLTSIATLDVDANGGRVTSLEPVENIYADKLNDGLYKFSINTFEQRDFEPNKYIAELAVGDKILSFKSVASNESNAMYNYLLFEVVVDGGKVVSIKSASDASVSYNKPNWNVNGFVKVNAIIPSPNVWSDKPTMIGGGNHIFFILDGCKDNTDNGGRGFFNEILIPELRDIRKVLEAYTSITPVEGADEATACGVGYNSDSDWNLVLRVTDKNGLVRLFNIDRMD